MWVTGVCGSLELGLTERVSVCQKWRLMIAGDRLKLAVFIAETYSQLKNFDDGYFVKFGNTKSKVTLLLSVKFPFWHECIVKGS